MFKKIIAGVMIVLGLAAPTHAQLGLNYTTFTPGQTISAAQFTENFTNISNKALNRTGGTATGTITFDGGAEFNGSFTIGSDDLQPFDSTGKIKEISSTYFASLSGANLTGLLEANITDGSLLARVGSTETITGAWTFSTAPTLAGTNITSLPETAITDGSILARVGSSETISGVWTFTAANVFSNVLTVTGNSGMASSGGSLQLASGYASPVIGRIFIGDGSGYRLHISSRSGSTNSDKFTFYDSGQLDITGAFTATSLRATTGTVSRPDLAGAAASFGNGANAFYGSTHQFNNAANTVVFGQFDSAGLIVYGALTSTGNTSVGGNLSVSGTLTAGTFSPTVVLAGDGSAAAPAYSFASDTDAGLFLDGTGLRLARSSVGSNILITGSAIILNPSGSSAFTSTASANISYAVLRPSGDNVITLGTSGERWSVVYAATGTINTSDVRFKRDIHPTDLGIEFIDKLKPVEYFWRDGPAKGKFYGFIAQDLQKLGFEGVDDSNPNKLGLRYTELIAPMVKAMQELHKEIHILEQQNKMLQAQVEVIVRRINNLERGDLRRSVE